MGSHPWNCIAPYEETLDEALRKARHKEFLQEVALDNASQYQGNEAAIEEGISEYIEECDADGTCSIIDVETILVNQEEFDYGCSCPLSAETLTRLFGTDKPSAETIHKGKTSLRSPISELYGMLDRGQSCYIVVYDGNKAKELHFFGMSYD